MTFRTTHYSAETCETDAEVERPFTDPDVRFTMGPQQSVWLAGGIPGENSPSRQRRACDAKAIYRQESPADTSVNSGSIQGVVAGHVDREFLSSRFCGKQDLSICFR